MNFRRWLKSLTHRYSIVTFIDGRNQKITDQVRLYPGDNFDITHNQPPIKKETSK